MDLQNIELKLYDIFKKFVPETDLMTLWEQNKDVPLTGAVWNFDAINMTYLFFEVEKGFSIHISPELLEKYRFNSIKGIVSIVGKLL